MGKPSIGTRARSLRPRHATNPRDKVFALASLQATEVDSCLWFLEALEPLTQLLGLNTKWLSELFQVDYYQTVERVFSSAAVHDLVQLDALMHWHM